MRERPDEIPPPAAGGLTEAWLQQAGYPGARQLPSGDWLAVKRLLYTTGLYRIRDGDRTGWQCRWDYRQLMGAVAAMNSWDGVGDDPPFRWIKQKGRDSGGRLVDRQNPASKERDFEC